MNMEKITPYFLYTVQLIILLAQIYCKICVIIGEQY